MSNDFNLQCPICKQRFWEGNITHNLGKMAGEAGLFNAIWRPRGNLDTETGYKDYKTAAGLLEDLRKGWADLLARPTYFEQFNPQNGWGNYDTLVVFTAKLIRACEEHPEAIPEAYI